MRISHASEGNCIGRAISTMRLALGYEHGLPANWQPGGKTTSELISLLGTSFPGREVLVACPDYEIDGAVLADRVCWLGSVMDFGKSQYQVNPDLYLIAFSYKKPGTWKSHIVIGVPCYSDLFCIPLIIAISLVKANA